VSDQSGEIKIAPPLVVPSPNKDTVQYPPIEKVKQSKVSSK